MTKSFTPKIGSTPTTKDVPVLTDKVSSKGKSYKRAGLSTFHKAEMAVRDAEKREKQENKDSNKKRSSSGHSRSGRGGGYVDLGPQSGWRKGRRKYGIRIEPKL